MALQVEVGVLGSVGQQILIILLHIEELYEVCLGENQDIEGAFTLEVGIFRIDLQKVTISPENCAILIRRYIKLRPDFEVSLKW